MVFAPSAIAPSLGRISPTAKLEQLFSLAAAKGLMPETRGTLNLAVPAVVSNALLRKITADWSYQKPRALPAARAQLKTVLLDCPFSLELRLAECEVPLASLASLEPGTLLALPRRADATAVILAEGRPLFQGNIVRMGDRRAVRVGSRIHEADVAKEW